MSNMPHGRVGHISLNCDDCTELKTHDDDRPADDTDVTRKNLGQSAMNDDTLRENRINRDSPEYAAIHHWAQTNLVDTGECEHCGATDRKLTWANKTGEYLRQADDWLRLCYSCHGVYDKSKNRCVNGHALDENNSYRITSKGRNQVRCRECNRTHTRKWAAANVGKIRLKDARNNRLKAEAKGGITWD